jgi:hypothetical protein
MAYLHYLSSFDSAISTFETTQDPRDPTEVDAAIIKVRQQLTERFPEESKESNAFAPEWADKRIEGSITGARQLRNKAVRYEALPQFTAGLDDLLVQAERALAIARERMNAERPPLPNPLPPGEWTRVESRGFDLDPDDHIYKALRELL